MFDPERWQPATVTHHHEWTEGLFSLHIDAQVPFLAGQYVKLGLVLDGEPVSRAYSIVTPPGEPLGFYLVRIDGGRLTPHLAQLREGDTVYVQRRAFGRLCVEHVSPGGTLWMVGTGTGLAPYVSMLAEGACFDTFDRVVVVHGVRTAAHLGYRERLEALAHTRPLTYLPFVSREQAPATHHGRLTQGLLDGRLEAEAGKGITPEASHVLLCGNPHMIADMRAALSERGFTLNTPRRPGRLHLEKYWSGY